ncbi:hypothetical protein CGMCC3_g17018 [Colletotrichum fructicola]|nr:uncharacterized protein CGMCC3_g17018 [Colletotrichum fructicola]KAE9566827.1 hypothetical protein CGMCC3_g17018 [Colletotrichum fructicola]
MGRWEEDIWWQEAEHEPEPEHRPRSQAEEEMGQERRGGETRGGLDGSLAFPSAVSTTLRGQLQQVGGDSSPSTSMQSMNMDLLNKGPYLWPPAILER